MLLTLVIILILIGSAVVGSLYSNFLVFYENFTETENYHKARYASIAALERAELVTKQREPGYVGSGGRIGSLDQSGSNSDKMPSGTGFSYLSKSFSSKSTIFWKINSRTNRIPSTGNGGNVEKLLSADDSPDYNMMDYENAEVLLLYYDKLLDGPYNKKSCPDDCLQTTDLESIKVAIRLPPYVRTKFGSLNTGKKLIEDGGFEDDAIVDWQIRGDFYEAGEPSAFTILATQDFGGFSTGENDSAIRESHLNQPNGLTFNFSEERNPITNQLAKPTIISPKDTTILLLDDAFKDVFYNSKNLQLRLSLLNLVLGGGEPGKRYPFLEYNVEFTPTDPSNPVILSDKYFTIETEGNFGDYQIDNIIFKPTVTETILRSFTTIF